MKIDYEGPYNRKRERRGMAQELRAYIAIVKIIAITAILLIGIVTLNRLDTIMYQQAHIIKTQADAMDQLMWIRMDIMLLELELEEILILKEDEIAPQSYYPLASEERDLVERVVAAEARGESVEGQMAIAQVIRDRATEWGMSVTDVVLAPGQFAPPYTGEISPEVVQAVWSVFDLGMEVFSEPVTHFHNDNITPNWTSSKVSRGQIGSHRFYQ